MPNEACSVATAGDTPKTATNCHRFGRL